MHANLNSTVSRRSTWQTSCRAIVFGCLLAGSGHALGQAQPASPPDPFDREVMFINFLLDQQLFPYANLAVEELRRAFPGETQRLQVAEASVLLRQGRTQPVEAMLEGRNFSTDGSAQALLLQLALTLDAMGRNEEALARYTQFLRATEGRELTHPDVLRIYPSAGIRLATLLQADKNFAEANTVLRRIKATADSEVLARKFRIMVIQNHIDHALHVEGAARTAQLEEARKEIAEILWGANDNYWFMAMAQHAWMDHIQGRSSEALTALNNLVEGARNIEVELERAEIPKTEFPRAIIRFVQGEILFDAAKAAHRQGDAANARSRAGQAASHFYNTFLRYEGNEYARRAGLRFEEVRAWVQETFGIELNIDQTSPQATARIFRRQLDLADELIRGGRLAEAEDMILTALSQYPRTPYTLGALNSLSRIWIEQENDWALMALADYAADLFPDDNTAANMLLRIGRRMLTTENEFGIESVLGTFGRNFPGQGNAPAMLFEIGRRAQDRGDAATAQRFFDQVIEFHPGSSVAVQVLRRRAADALRARNFEEAVKAFTIVRDQAPPGFLRAEASFGIADAKLRSEDEDMRAEGLQNMQALRTRLTPADDSIYYRGDDAARSLRLFRNVRFSLAQAMIRQAREQGSDALRDQALQELQAFREEYPGSEQDSLVMFTMGRLFLQQGNFQAATQMFEELARVHPDSDEGRDALFSLVRAALEEGQIEMAQGAVQRMVAQPQSYSTEQIFQVGQLMLNNNRYQEAFDSLSLVQDSERARTDTTFRQRLLIGLGRAAVGAGRASQAVTPLETLMRDFPNSALVVDAGVILSEAFMKLDPPDPDKAQAALGQVARIIQHRRSQVDQAKLDLAAGEVAFAQGQTGPALASFYRVGLSRPEQSEELAELVRRGIIRGIEVAQPMAEGGDTAKWGLIVDLTQQFIDHFPLDRRTSAMRSLNVRAVGLAQ